MIAAREMGVPLVNLWMGQDGFDYPLVTDYDAQWRNLVEGLRECAAVCPEVRLSLEYKRAEPRAKCVPNSAAQALLAVREAGNANLGNTLGNR